MEQSIKFIKDIASPICEKYDKRLKEILKQEKERWIKDFENGIKELFQKRIQAKKREISYIRISFLRTPILFQEYEWRIDGMNQWDWLDKNPITVTLNMNQYFGLLEEMEKELREKAKPYENMIEITELEKMKLTEYETIANDMIQIAKQEIQKRNDIDYLYKLQKKLLFIISAGEYRDYQEDIMEAVKNERTVHRELKKNS